MAQFEISVTEDYVPDWGLQAAVRELLQNAKDEEDACPDHAMRISYSVRKKALTITSENVALDRAVLLLGETSKRRTGARGQFGEGLALALLALVRGGYALRIENGPESWIPDIRYSDAWGRSVMVVETRKLQQPRSHFQVQIDGVDQDDWVTLTRRCRFLPGADKDDITIVVNRDTIILNRPGDVFAKGLWVGKMPGLCAGYDLDAAEVDRDRRLVNTWTLQASLGRIWADAIAAVPGAIDHAVPLIQRGAEDVAGLAATFRYSATPVAKKAVADRFDVIHGSNAVPVTTTTDADKASAAGAKPVIVSQREREIVEAARGQTLADVIAAGKRRIERTLSPDDLAAAGVTERWRFIYELAGTLTAPAAPPPMSVVEFADAATIGMWTDDTVLIALRALQQSGPGQAVVTICHELAHAVATDHGLDHEKMSEALLEQAIDGIAGVEW